MNSAEILAAIAEKDFDLDQFVQMALNDENARDEIVYHMRTNPAIMVYYHCYYIVDKASQKQPELFYPYWDEMAALLHHQNSYHRDFGLEIIGNLTRVDEENRFSQIADDYYGLVNDEKFMTGNLCVKNLMKICRHKAEQRGRILELLLDIDNRCDYTDKQKGVLKADVLDIFDAVFEEAAERDAISEFIRAERNSISPKTRKKAKALVAKYAL